MLTKNTNIYTYTLLALLTINTIACSEDSKPTNNQKTNASDSNTNVTTTDSAKQTITEADIAGTGISIEYAQTILKIKNAFANKDIATIAKHVSYPLRVASDLPKIQNEEEFTLRHKEVLDDELLNQVGLAKLNEWSDMKSEGTMFNGGILWLNTAGNIIAFNNDTNHKLTLQKQEKEKRHLSAQNYQKNMMQFKTDKFIIKVDETNDDYQYVAWGADNDISEEPDLILTEGTYEAQGSQGGIIYIFKKGNYTYKVEEILLGSKDSPNFKLYVEKDGKTIIEQDSVDDEKDTTELYNMFGWMEAGCGEYTVGEAKYEKIHLNHDAFSENPQSADYAKFVKKIEYIEKDNTPDGTGEEKKVIHLENATYRGQPLTKILNYSYYDGGAVTMFFDKSVNLQDVTSHFKKGNGSLEVAYNNTESSIRCPFY